MIDRIWQLGWCVSSFKQHLHNASLGINHWDLAELLSAHHLQHHSLIITAAHKAKLTVHEQMHQRLKSLPAIAPGGYHHL